MAGLCEGGNEPPGSLKAIYNRITASEMRFMRRTAGYTKWNRKINEDILKELQINSILADIMSLSRKLASACENSIIYPLLK
ncbi:hypothetical protein ANN_10339 [Periplaneta americana]|uniref:Uncharacterized protein n=1 Tax=Periplaneta americana TaxID=6978 RepID=A0ABQ8TRW5_PERAM|nr:hypothetical protein ANN_10339 [Periplaneta americana]